MNSAIGLLDRKTVPAQKNSWKGPKLGVVNPHSFNVIAAGYRDAVLRALKLRLQRKKILVRLEIGIVLADSKKAA